MKKSLMEMYNVVSKIDRLLLDELFISMVNKKNYDKYREMFIFINNKYNNAHLFSVDKTNVTIMQIDFDKYLSLYFNKYNSNKKNIFFDPLTIELLNNSTLYNKYVKPIVNINEEECFKQIKKFSNKFLQNIDAFYNNYDNPYYINFMTYIFNNVVSKRKKLSIGEMEKFVKFFVKKEANDLDLKIDFKLVTKTELLKRLLNKKDQRFTLQKIKTYGKTYASYCKVSDEQSFIFFNISNYRKYFLSTQWSLERILKTIYHECRHALQSNGKISSLSNIDERDQVIIQDDYGFYSQNHQFFETEIDADIYGIDGRNFVLRYYLSNFEKCLTDNIEKLVLLTNKYEKKMEFEKKVDVILQNKPNLIKNKKQLQKEYYSDGYPKGIFDILNQRSFNTNKDEIVVYNEMIIRSLNRMNELEFVEKLLFMKESCPFYLEYVEQAVEYKVNEMLQIYSFINSEYQKNNICNFEFKNYHNKMKNYWMKVQYYQQQLSTIKQMGVAKR